MNALQRAEYVTLRLVRRFLFSERMANRLARCLPYYAPSVNEAQPLHIVDEYAGSLASAGATFAGRRVLEVGAGRTNAVGHGLLAAGANKVTLLEPYVAFDAGRDATLRASVPAFAAADASAIRRVAHFAEIDTASIDVLLSNSVLEHVRDLRTFLADCRRVLAPDGLMLHVVDYRDHFFKYPYAFLTFREATWKRWLDPGDLPRWRLPDHLREFAAAGFTTDVLARESAAEEFARVRTRLADPFADGTPGIEVTRATFSAWHAT